MYCWAHALTRQQTLLPRAISRAKLDEGNAANTMEHSHSRKLGYKVRRSHRFGYLTKVYRGIHFPCATPPCNPNRMLNLSVPPECTPLMHIMLMLVLVLNALPSTFQILQCDSAVSPKRKYDFPDFPPSFLHNFASNSSNSEICLIGCGPAETCILDLKSLTSVMINGVVPFPSFFLISPRISPSS
jgi:hypothetical protein